jgi:hypothetical protein
MDYFPYMDDTGCVVQTMPVTIWDTVWHPPVKTRKGDYFVNERRMVKIKVGDEAAEVQWVLVTETVCKMILAEHDRRVRRMVGMRNEILDLDDLDDPAEPRPAHYGAF